MCMIKFIQNNNALEPILCLLSSFCVIVVVSVHVVMCWFGTKNHSNNHVFCQIYTTNNLFCYNAIGTDIVFSSNLFFRSDYAMSLCPGGPTGSKNMSRSHALRCRAHNFLYQFN
jgi:hypothetical protein